MLEDVQSGSMQLGIFRIADDVLVHGCPETAVASRTFSLRVVVERSGEMLPSALLVPVAFRLGASPLAPPPPLSRILPPIPDVLPPAQVGIKEHAARPAAQHERARDDPEGGEENRDSG
jgi:hypothetical protein